MHRTSFVPRLVGWASFFAFLTLLIGTSTANAQALLPASFAQQQSPDIQQNANTTTMVVGTTQTYMMANKADLKKVENPNNKVLDVRAIPNQLNVVQLVAIGPGRTRVTFTDVKDRVEFLDVVVISDRVKELRDLIARSVPTASINVNSTDSGSNIILSGTVLTTEDLRTIQSLAQAVGGGVVNNVRIGGVQQISLEVIVALVNRSEARNMAFSWNLNGNNFFVSSLLSGPFAFANSLAAGPTAAAANLSSSTSLGGANVPFGVLSHNGSFMGFLQALRTENLAKIMAEPRITTLSGRPAYIISGGETPILTSSGVGAPSVSYKQFGTVVHVLPIVLGNGKIHLEVRPEISQPDPTLNVLIAGTTPTSVPGFRTRSAQATVQIEDGQTLAIGGLIQNTVTGTINRVPVLGDLPFLGVAFTSKQYTETEEELIILVTPRLVDPFDCTKFPKYLPGRETRSPDDFELFLEGIMEAPRGPRSVVFHPHYYKPAYHNAPNAGNVPCADGNCYGGYNGGGGCASGNCGAPMSSGARPAGYLSPAVTNTPAFPDVPPANFRVTVEGPDGGSIRNAPGLGPVSPALPASNPLPPAREFENRPSLPPLTPGVFGNR
jgi:pilus assembly protein CpaC